LIKILSSFEKTILSKMLTKIYLLLTYTFSVEYLSGLAFKPQNN